jgi:excinuclease ABC subunit C
MVDIPEALAEKVRGLPREPGIYKFKDAAGKTLYVGKATSLRSRVGSYFQAPESRGGKTALLVSHIADVEYILSGSPLQALQWESDLIKEERPKYNVVLRDDKHYPYVRITVQEPWPRLEIARRIAPDGARYFGPFTDAGSVRRTMDTLNRLFPYILCTKEITGTDPRPCLYYYINRCVAPCIGAVGNEQYRALIDQVIRFMEGRTQDVLNELRREMEEAAERLDFEHAAALRDRIRAAERVVEQQAVVTSAHDDFDIIAIATGGGGQEAAADRSEDGVSTPVADRAAGEEGPGVDGGALSENDGSAPVGASIPLPDGGAAPQSSVLSPQSSEACAQVFFMRGGRMVGREHFILQNTQGETPGELVRSFLLLFYGDATQMPKQVFVSQEPEDGGTMREWLDETAGHRVELRVPKRGEGQRLMELAKRNAAETLVRSQLERANEQLRSTGAMEELQEALELPTIPVRVECFDISHVQGAYTVASMSVAENGRPKNADYRRFRIKTVDHNNDFASMQEVIRRRFGHLVEQRRNPTEDNEKWGVIPDLVVIDGGKGQLNAALEVMRELELEIPMVGLAKQYEEVFLPGRSDPVILPRDSAGLFLLQRVRDEAHRFAITYHRASRGKGALKSSLDEIPGVGPKRKRALCSGSGTSTPSGRRRSTRSPLSPA